MFTETPEAQAIIAWHDSQTEEFLASLPGYEDGLTPRQAWEAFCSLPATKQPGEGLVAPADAGQGAGTINVDDLVHNALSDVFGILRDSGLL